MSIWTKTSSGWVEIGGGGGSDGLEGLGGWAEITEVTGSPKRYAYNDGMDWVAFEWTQDGSLTTQAGGLVQALAAGGGAAGSSYPSTGGEVVTGVENVATSNPIVIGAGGVRNSGPTTGAVNGRDTALGSITAYGGVGNASGASFLPVRGKTSDIKNGTDEQYGRGNQATPRLNSGDGAATTAANAADGVVIVKVPAAQAAGVDPGSWVTRIDYYAEVTDGTVTDTYQERFYGDDTVRTENGRFASPEQPDDLIPCDPSVAEGWTYADGEFTPPPPDPSWREEAIEALKEQLKDLQKDT